MSATKVPVKRTLTATLAAVAQGATATTIVGRAPFAGRISAVKYIPNSNITGANTNTRKITIVNKGGAGSGTNEAAGLQFNSGVNATAFAGRTITNNGTATNRDVAEGDVIVAVSTHLASGLADPGGLIVVEIERS